MKRKSPSKGFFFLFFFSSMKKGIKEDVFSFWTKQLSTVSGLDHLNSKTTRIDTKLFHVLSSCLYEAKLPLFYYFFQCVGATVQRQPCNNKYFDIRSPNSTVSSTDLWLIASLMCSCSFADRPQHVFLVLFWFPPQANQTRLGSWRLLMAENRHSWHGVSITLNRHQKALPITAQLQKKMFMDIDRFICF